MLIKKIQLEMFHVEQDVIQTGDIIAYKQSDYNTKQIYVSLVSQKLPYEIPENALILWNCERPDGTATSFNVEVISEENANGDTENIIVCTLGSWHTLYEGEIYSDISVITDSGKLTSQIFSIYIPKSIITDTENENDNNYPVIVKILNDIATLQGQIQEKQPKLVATGEDQNVKTINGQSILGKGNLEISGTDSSLPEVTQADNGKVLQVDNGEWKAKDLPTYNGSYNVIPRVSMQNLNTASKYMTDDVEISAIPYAEVGNFANGETITIG